MKKKLNYRRRRGVYIPPLFKLLALLLAAAGAFAWVRYGRETGGGQAVGGIGPEPGQSAPSQEPLPEKITTPAGVACTLTRLGEELLAPWLGTVGFAFLGVAG